MSSFLTLEVARDLVADQFSYPSDEDLRHRDVAPAPARSRRARVRASRLLHRLGDAVAPSSYSTAH